MGKYFWVLAGLVVVFVIYYFSGGKLTDKYSGVETMSPSPSSAVAGSVVKPATKGKTAPTSIQSYTQLVKEYEGRRIQFDERCQATPKDPTFKNGTSILLDNRSASPRTVAVGGTEHYLIAYGYKIITLSSSNLPKELLVSCGSSGNVGKILLQAQILQ